MIQKPGKLGEKSPIEQISDLSTTRANPLVFKTKAQIRIKDKEVEIAISTTTPTSRTKGQTAMLNLSTTDLSSINPCRNPYLSISLISYKSKGR